MTSPPFPNPEYQRPEPTDPAEIHFRKAWELRKQKRFEEAVAEFRKSLEHQADRAATHFNLALTLDNLNQGDEALRHARQAVVLFNEGGDPSKIATGMKFFEKMRKKYETTG